MTKQTKDIDRVRFSQALERIRSDAKKKGFDRLSMKEIDKIIATSRKERKSSASGK